MISSRKMQGFRKRLSGLLVARTRMRPLTGSGAPAGGEPPAGGAPPAGGDPPAWTGGFDAEIKAELDAEFDAEMEEFYAKTDSEMEGEITEMEKLEEGGDPPAGGAPPAWTGGYDADCKVEIDDEFNVSFGWPDVCGAELDAKIKAELDAEVDAEMEEFYAKMDSEMEGEIAEMENLEEEGGKEAIQQLEDDSSLQLRKELESNKGKN